MRQPTEVRHEGDGVVRGVGGAGGRVRGAGGRAHARRVRAAPGGGRVRAGARGDRRGPVRGARRHLLGTPGRRHVAARRAAALGPVPCVAGPARRRVRGGGHHALQRGAQALRGETRRHRRLDESGVPGVRTGGPTTGDLTYGTVPMPKNRIPDFKTDEEAARVVASGALSSAAFSCALSAFRLPTATTSQCGFF